MKTVNRALFAAAVTVSAGLGSLAPANAATETWNFNSPTGTLGTTQPYLSTPDGISITAAGFITGPTFATLATPVLLFGKNDAGDEAGVGIAADPSGDHEIFGNPNPGPGDVVRITVPTGVTLTSFTMGSVQTGEGWALYGTHDAAGLTGYALITSGTTDGTFSLPTGFTAFYFAATSGNVLLDAVAGTSTVPLPGALPLFVTGLGLMGLLRMRRKRSVAAT